MINTIQVAKPYAKAAYQFAKDQDQIVRWQEFLALFAQLMGERKICMFLQQPGLGCGKKIEVLVSFLSGVADEEKLNFIKLLTENNRLTAVPEIFKQFMLLYKADKNVIDVKVISARKLSDEHKTQLVEALKLRIKHDVQLTEKIDTSLLAGIKVCIGDQVIDNSVLSQLNRLRQHLQLKEILCP